MCDDLKTFAKLLDAGARCQEDPERKRIFQEAADDMKKKAEDACQK